jgi:hypothetical protein
LKIIETEPSLFKEEGTAGELKLSGSGAGKPGRAVGTI